MKASYYYLNNCILMHTTMLQPQKYKACQFSHNPSICLTSDQVFKLTNKITKIAKILYQETIGTLIYMVLKTYLNIIYAVQLLSYFQRILKSLIGKLYNMLLYISKTLMNCGSLMADWSQISMAIQILIKIQLKIDIQHLAMLFNSGAISWSTKHQELIILLTTESKYIIATHTSKEALWLYLFISEIFGKKLEATILFSDNQFIITLTQDCQFHIHTKHINICYHFICQTIERRQNIFSLLLYQKHDH